MKIIKKTEEKKKTVWLCSGDVLGKGKKEKPCMYARIEIKDFDIPLFARSERTKTVTRFLVFCSKKMCYIRKWVKECNDFQNTNLNRMFISKEKNNMLVTKKR